MRNGSDVTGRQTRALPDGLASDRHDRGLPVIAEGRFRIVHYRPEIVRSDIIAISDVLVEVVFATALNIRPHDPHEPVTILATLFMPQTACPIS